MAFLERYGEQIYALVRIVVGFLFLCHGVQKLMLGTAPPQMPAPLFWAAALIEAGGGALVLLGLFAGPAAFIASGTMAVAYFMAHQSRGWLLPIQNEGELAALYCWIFLLIAARGSGIWSARSGRCPRPRCARCSPTTRSSRSTWAAGRPSSCSG
jgi:putative oxidoreductase